MHTHVRPCQTMRAIPRRAALLWRSIKLRQVEASLGCCATSESNISWASSQVVLCRQYNFQESSSVSFSDYACEKGSRGPSHESADSLLSRLPSRLSGDGRRIYRNGEFSPTRLQNQSPISLLNAIGGWATELRRAVMMQDYRKCLWIVSVIVIVFRSLIAWRSDFYCKCFHLVPRARLVLSRKCNISPRIRKSKSRWYTTSTLCCSSSELSVVFQLFSFITMCRGVF